MSPEETSLISILMSMLVAGSATFAYYIRQKQLGYIKEIPIKK
jgi:hypothetical protein